ncbi:MAG: hypothetical protein M1840_005549 [Geoglossum simile]|nr:MAG: hypothetical protein M1840_005549 [Geoglossum simile]
MVHITLVQVIATIATTPTTSTTLERSLSTTSASHPPSISSGESSSTSAPSPSQKTHSKRGIAIGAGVGVTLAAAFVAALLLFFMVRRRQAGAKRAAEPLEVPGCNRLQEGVVCEIHEVPGDFQPLEIGGSRVILPDANDLTQDKP